MKKVIILFISILVFVFLLMSLMVGNDNRYVNKKKTEIIKNTSVEKINYMNIYDGYYIVDDDNYIYLFNKDYKEILKEDKLLVHKNTKGYDIIYKDNSLMYLEEENSDNGLVYKYYDIGTYELLNKVVVGGD